jgi:hypothetical protein
VLIIPAIGQDVFIIPKTEDLLLRSELAVIIAILAGINSAHEALYNMNKGVTCCHEDA